MLQLVNRSKCAVWSPSPEATLCEELMALAAESPAGAVVRPPLASQPISVSHCCSLLYTLHESVSQLTSQLLAVRLSISDLSS